MPEVPRRKWLQVHLSTAVLLMFAAGGVIWANAAVRDESYGIQVAGGVSSHYQLYILGWPMDALHRNGFESEFIALGVAIDIATAAAILFAVWFVCEWWIRFNSKCKMKNSK